MRSELAAAVERLVSLLGAELPRPLCGRARRRRHVAAVHGTDELVTQVQPAPSERVSAPERAFEREKTATPQATATAPKLASTESKSNSEAFTFLFGKGSGPLRRGGGEKQWTPEYCTTP